MLIGPGGCWRADRSRAAYPSKLAVIAAVVLATVLVGGGTALAHVETEPGQATQGADAAFVTFSVPNEEPTAGVVKLRVGFPPDHPLAHALPTPLAGWTSQVANAPLNPPVRQNNTDVAEAVTTITWTANPGAQIAPHQALRFAVLAGPIPDNTDQLIFTVAQTYSNGDTVRWDAPPPAPGAAEPEHPAPVLHLVAAAGSGIAPAGPASAPSGPDMTARWLAGIGIGLGALGLGPAIATRTRRRW